MRISVCFLLLMKKNLSAYRLSGEGNIFKEVFFLIKKICCEGRLQIGERKRNNNIDDCQHMEGKIKPSTKK